MNVNLTALNISHLIASDAPLSPLSEWEHNQYSPVSMEFGLNYNYSYPSPPHSVGSLSSASPIPVSRVLRGRMSPDSSDSEQQLCLPTHQVFDMSLAPTPEPLSSPPAPLEPLPLVRGESIRSDRSESTRSASLVPAKRASSLAPSTAKKPRSSAVSVKDFVPPDVTGLSKREARLVKNRAAAFLSRQRKREEFETMEQRVAELEQENARLLELAQRGGSRHQDVEQDTLVSEVEQLRNQLAAAEARERELSEELSRKAISRVKAETVEPQLSLSSRNGVAQLHKSGASLGLMVLLCALPSLVSLPSHSNVPTTFSLPLPNHHAMSASSFDMRSFAPGEFDWLNAGGSLMDVDADAQRRMHAQSSHSSARRLEFVDPDAEALGLSGLDISFDATPSHDGKIRVRIHPPASISSASSDAGSDNDDQSMSGSSECGSVDADQLGPFLGIGADYGMAMSGAGAQNSVLSPPSGSFPLQPTFDMGCYGQDFGVATPAGRRRVRIALKSMPGEGREGGEWEVQVC